MCPQTLPAVCRLGHICGCTEFLRSTYFSRINLCHHDASSCNAGLKIVHRTFASKSISLHCFSSSSIVQMGTESPIVVGYVFTGVTAVPAADANVPVQALKCLVQMLLAVQIWEHGILHKLTTQGFTQHLRQLFHPALCHVAVALLLTVPKLSRRVSSGMSTYPEVTTVSTYPYFR